RALVAPACADPRSCPRRVRGVASPRTRNDSRCHPARERHHQRGRYRDYLDGLAGDSTREDRSPSRADGRLVRPVRCLLSVVLLSHHARRADAVSGARNDLSVRLSPGSCDPYSPRSALYSAAVLRTLTRTLPHARGTPANESSARRPDRRPVMGDNLCTRYRRLSAVVRHLLTSDPSQPNPHAFVSHTVTPGMKNVTDRTSNPFGMHPPCEAFVPSYGDANADFHLIGDHPGVHGGRSTGVPFTNTAGRKLLSVFETVGLLSAPDSDAPEVENLFL